MSSGFVEHLFYPSVAPDDLVALGGLADRITLTRRSLKDLIRAISATVTTVPPPYPLPRDLVTAIQSFLDRHVDDDENEQQRLNDELLNVHANRVQGHKDRQLTYIAILNELKPALRGRERLMVWWECLLQPTMQNLESTKSSVVDARQLVLKMLVYDEDDDIHGDLKDVSDLFTDLLFEKYIAMSKTQSADPKEDAESSDESRFMCSNLEDILLSFGKRRAKAFLLAADSYIVNKETRLQILGLLCSLVKMQGPHLYQILETPVLDHLLLCLQMDTSTTVVSLSLTTLLMFMPHIPNALATYLPRLFAIYARLLCWDNYGVPVERHDSFLEDSTAKSSLSFGVEDWQKCESSFPIASSSAPDVSELFTFLYGMYPVNLMAFLKEPYKFLDREDVRGFEDIELDDHLIRQRTEPHRQRHLLHGNFFTLTEEKELTDKARWMKSEPSDVVAQCVGLIAPNVLAYEESTTHQDMPGALVPTDEIPVESLLGEGSQRDTSEDEGIGMDNHRLKPRPHANGKSSRSSTPGVKPVEPHGLDSPTLPPAGPLPPLPNFSEDRLQDMMQLHGTLRGGKVNGSSASLAGTLAANDPSSPRLKAYVQSLSLDNRVQSPALKPAATDAQGTIAYLQRENILLKNDLNFERYLKQQHLAHIGSLQRKHIKDASIEAETNNLINTNKILKRKIEEAAKAYQKLREEGTKTKLDARKWEAELNSRIQKLREEKKIWKEEEETVKAALVSARNEANQLRKLVVDSEAKELQSRQRMQAIEQSLADLEALKAQNEQLNKRLKEFKYTEESIEVYKEIEKACHAQVDKIKLRLKARETEREKMKRAYEERIGDLQNKLAQAQNERDQNPSPPMQAMIDSALHANASHLSAMKKAYNQLLMRFTELEIKYIELQAANELEKLPNARNAGQSPSFNSEPTPILHIETDPMSAYPPRDHRMTERDFSGQKQIMEHHSPKAIRSYQLEHPSAGPSYSTRQEYQHQHHAYTSPNLSTFPPQQIDRRPSPVHRHTRDVQTRAPYDPGMSSQGEMSPEIYSPPPQGLARPSLAPSSSVNSHDDAVSLSNSFTSTGSKEKRPKIKPQSEIRVRGRGGVQNIGKKEKEKEEKKKEKKNKLVSGFRGFGS
ncbi:Hamartin [Drechslerella dactyloides]|uniref:Hamartin n=1 Tax=Drechslerella dactyloides TaxID=74499 RepID=A0AAD6IVN6_DREDA|nr:Hamartin [Drechslerella dactyloides]